MMKQYYNKRKHSILPFIKDFTDEQTGYKKANIKDLSWKQWFWLHPSSYKLIHYGNNILNIIIYLTGIILITEPIIKLILIILIIPNTKQIIQKIETRAANKDMTFYELYLKE